MTADQTVVHKGVDQDGKDRGDQRQENLLGGTKRGGGNLVEDGQKGSDAEYFEILRAKEDHLRIIGENAH